MISLAHSRPPRAAASATVLRLPPRQLALHDARLVIASPLYVSLDDLDAACTVLESIGDWMDVERARHMRRQIGRAGVERMIRDGQRARRRLLIAAGLGALLTALVVVTLTDRVFPAIAAARIEAAQ